MSKMNFLEPGRSYPKGARIRKCYARDEDFNYSFLLTLLKDETNVNFYRRIFQDNKNLFKDKVVLDAGCGSGLLTLFAVEAGAAKVYAIEGSSLAYYVDHIFWKNKVSDVVTLIKSNVEEAELPEDTKVDVIFSGWMWHCGFYSSFFEPLVFARDKWLKPGGIIVPNVITLYVVGVADAENYDKRVECYEKVRGVNFGCLRNAAIKTAFNLEYGPDKVITTKYMIHTIDMNTAAIQDIEHSKRFHLRALKNDFMHGIVLFFNVQFMNGGYHEKVSTSPDAKENSWKPHLFYLNEPLVLKKDEVVSGKVTIKYFENMIKTVEIKVVFNGRSGRHSETKQYLFMN